MPVKCTLMDGKWRLVDSDGKVAHSAKHDDEESCKKQASAMNANMELSVSKEDTFFQNLSLDSATSTDDPLVFEKELIYVGDFKKGDQEFTVDRPLLDHWISTFSEWSDLGVEVPLPVEHTRDPEKRRATLQKLSVKKNSKGKDGLFGRLAFRDSEAAKLAKTADVSIFSPKETERAGKTWKRPIEHIAFTDYPVIHGLGDFELVASLVSTKEPAMDSLKELLGDLNLSLEEGQDPKDLILSQFKALGEKVKGLESQVESLSGDLKLAKSNQKITPIKPSEAQLEMIRENYDLKLSKLVGPKISKAVKDKLQELFCSTEDLCLALTPGAPDNKFSKLLDILAMNEVVLEEASGPQALKLSQDQVLQPNHNPLIADAEKRAKAAASN